MLAPAAVLLGCCTKTTLLAGAAVMLKLLLAGDEVRPALDACRFLPLPAALIWRSPNVARPLTSVNCVTVAEQSARAIDQRDGDADAGLRGIRVELVAKLHGDGRGDGSARRRIRRLLNENNVCGRAC